AITHRPAALPRCRKALGAVAAGLVVLCGMLRGGSLVQANETVDEANIDDRLYSLVGRPLVDAVFGEWVERPIGDEVVKLVPGDGFDGPAPQPMPSGDPSVDGYDATAIARWATVPYQI